MKADSIKAIAADLKSTCDRIAPRYGFDPTAGVEDDDVVNTMLREAVEDMIDRGVIVTPARLQGALDALEDSRLGEARLFAKARDAERHVENPRPRLFEFCTGNEIDVDRYVALSTQNATAFLQTRHSYIRVEFETVEQMRSEIERMRRFRDEGTARGVERRVASMSDDEIRQTLVDVRASVSRSILAADGGGEYDFETGMFVGTVERGPILPVTDLPKRTAEANHDRSFSSPWQFVGTGPIFAAGDRVQTKDGQTGTIVRIHHAPNNYVIELDDPDPSGGVIMHWPVGADGLQAL